MAVLKKYDLTGKELGEISIEDRLMESTANGQMIKDYIVALRQNARQWSANTKGRAEVCHSGQKPHPQKGTGRARQGYLGAPQYKGGGRVHTPKPKFDQFVRINKKERRAAIRHLLIEKIQANKLHVLHLGKIDAPKTKRVADFLKGHKLEGKRILFLGEGVYESASSSPAEKYDAFVKSINNIQKTEFLLMPNVSGYDVVVPQDIFVMDTALDELMMILEGRG